MIHDLVCSILSIFWLPEDRISNRKEKKRGRTKGKKGERGGAREEEEEEKRERRI